ncbi:YqgQ family protein [Planococcus shenhongbingii]|uniref:YqgQ family protein n=1 Tax=Planococcus shenhongbingii TaxID=3058398 RepID=A0ABT8ND06_9BACL|nr:MULTISPECIES: YqgQ family protein [unclassified Planococcus (in: firmicutes)]MDN7245761.1 YqgQ family protein [Planococcus sp. N017]WKA60127.1 YqgQ family protein [Planococcus sp. N016]
MKTLYDVMQLLKRYGTIIYTGDPKADLELMEEEIRELYRLQFISAKEFSTAMLILRQKKSQ